MSQRLTESDQLVAMARKDTQRERQSVGEKLAEIRKLEGEIKEREAAIETHKRQYTELENKLRQVE